MADVGGPPVEDKPPETSGPSAWLHILVQIAIEGGKAVGADVAVKKGGRWIKDRFKAPCPERGKPVTSSDDFCPKCGKPMPRPPALHP